MWVWFDIDRKKKPASSLACVDEQGPGEICSRTLELPSVLQLAHSLMLCPAWECCESLWRTTLVLRACGVNLEGRVSAHQRLYSPVIVFQDKKEKKSVLVEI